MQVTINKVVAHAAHATVQCGLTDLGDSLDTKLKLSEPLRVMKTKHIECFEMGDEFIVNISDELVLKVAAYYARIASIFAPVCSAVAHAIAVLVRETENIDRVIDEQ